MHLWTITPQMIVFSAHISLKENFKKIDKEALVSKINSYLSSKYGIIESTIQISKDIDLIKC